MAPSGWSRYGDVPVTPDLTGRAVLGAAAVALAALGGSMVVSGLRPQSPPRPVAATVGLPGPVGRPDPVVATASAPVPVSRSVPVYLDIPAIGVHTGLIPLGVNPDGTMATPPPGRGAPAGWYRYLMTPGEPGPAVIVGHVDSARDGPAVFFRLGELRPGDAVSVRRADGGTLVFTIVSVAEYPKARFPTGLVYGPDREPRLELITCGGAFDRARHRYRDSIVAFARLR